MRTIKCCLSRHHVTTNAGKLYNTDVSKFYTWVLHRIIPASMNKASILEW